MDSNDPRKVLTVNKFREELDHITASVVSKINGYQEINPGDVVVDCEALLHHIRQQLVPGGYLIQPNAINVSAGLGPMFRKLPREIRDIIFGKLLASGHPQFLRASKIMSLEGTSLISKHAVFRVNVGFGSKANCVKITQQVADTVQNLHLRVDMTQYTMFGLGEYPEGDILKMFSNSNICRKFCSVSFECRFTTRDLVALEVLHSLKLLKEFEEVTLKINEITDFFGGMSYPDHLHARLWNEVYKKHRHVYLDLACQQLEPGLGTAYRVQNREGTQLVFHPRFSGQGKAKDTSGKDKCKWVKWEDGKE